MQTITILTDRVNYEKDIALVRESWLRELFAFIGFDVVYLDSLSRDAALDFFTKKKLELIYYVDLQALKVKFEGEIIGEWMGPEIELIKENGFIFNKVKINYWSIIDKQLDIKED